MNNEEFKVEMISVLKSIDGRLETLVRYTRNIVNDTDNMKGDMLGLLDGMTKLEGHADRIECSSLATQCALLRMEKKNGDDES